MNNHHPIELALAITLATIESVLWLINELAGLHSSAAGFHNHSVAQWRNKERQAPTPAQIQTIRQQQYLELVENYTVKQLRQLTGITKRRVLKAELKAKALCLTC